MDDRNKELTPPPSDYAAPPPEFTLPPELLPPDTALPGEKAAAAGALGQLRGPGDVAVGPHRQ